MAYLEYLPDDDNTVTEKPRRLSVVISVAIAFCALIFAAWWFMRQPSIAPVVPAQRAEQARPPDRPAVARPPVPKATPAPATEPRPPVRATAPRPAAPAVEAETTVPSAPTRQLLVESDVTGAMVFLDRKYLGNAPVSTSEVTPGTHQLNVSAEGYDGIARSVDVAESGDTTVTMRLKEVHLSQSVAVVHKHAMGSCQGMLSADLTGFKYVPASGDDGFLLPLDALEGLDVDYLKKNLRVKRKGGKTWNFESPTGNADALLVFQREVDKARSKLRAVK